jgi:hypothetical protein
VISSGQGNYLGKELKMKTKVLVALAALLLPISGYAYQIQGGAPDKVPNALFKPVLKSTVAGVSDQIASGGELLSYSTADADGKTVTRVGEGTGVGKGSLIACVSREAVATGDSAYHLCQTMGYAAVKYDASSLEWAAGEQLCANSVGAAVNCAAASSKSGVISLETKPRGTSGGALRVMLKLE